MVDVACDLACDLVRSCEADGWRRAEHFARVERLRGGVRLVLRLEEVHGRPVTTCNHVFVLRDATLRLNVVSRCARPGARTVLRKVQSGGGAAGLRRVLRLARQHAEAEARVHWDDEGGGTTASAEPLAARRQVGAA